MTQTLKNNVPSAMRKPLEKAEVILPVVISQHYGGDLSETIEFIGGALDHQAKLTAVDEAGKSEAPSFIVIPNRVEVIERKANGKLFGKKAKIHFTDPRDGTKQEMDTGWTEYYGTDVHEYAAWQTSLANTIVRVAEENFGNECVMTKAYVKGVKTKHSSSGRVKFIADLTPRSASDAKASVSKPSSADDERPAASSRTSRTESDEITFDTFCDALEAVKDATDSQIDSALEEKALIKSVVEALNGKKAIDDALDILVDDRGDDLTEALENEYIDLAESGKLLKAAATLFAVTAKK